MSPLSLEVVDGAVVPASCDPFVDRIDDAADEPTTSVAWAAETDVQGVAEEVVVWAGSDAARSHLEDRRLAEAGPCLGDLWVAALAQEDRVLTVSSAEAQIDPSFGSEAVWWRLVGQVEGGLALDLYTDVVVVRVDRVVVSYRFSSALEPVPVDVQREVVSAHAQQIELLIAAQEFEASDGTGTDADAEDAGE